MNASATIAKVLASPFPGLRAFKPEESIFFFGREQQTAELLRRLSAGRLLGITGASGCGKSSLVYAGLLPMLYCGYLTDTTSRWRIAAFRPGKAPIDALAAALARDEALGLDDVKTLRQTLGETSGGLFRVVRQSNLASGESLLIVADQFEELFRFANESSSGDGERALFVSLLLRAVESDAPIYVALTMRSEYQGDCAQFPGFPEALNRSQYLVPRMTQEQCQQAIVKPLQLVGTGITTRLVNRLLNDMGHDPGQLPVLQHALLRTYQHWKLTDGQTEIDLDHYNAKEVGGISGALAIHADSILNRFSEEKDKGLAERIFRCLTGLDGRRPKERDEIYKVVNARDEETQARVNNIIEAFVDDSLLTLSKTELEPDTVVDITHESLISKWSTLKGWAEEEAKSGEWYRELVRDVVRRRTNEAGLWQDPELSKVLDLRTQEWNEAWRLQHEVDGDPPFDEVDGFLEESTGARGKRRRTRAGVRLFITALVVLLLVLAVAFLFDRRERNAAVQREVALQLKKQQIQEDSSLKRGRALAIDRRLLFANSEDREKLLAEREKLEQAIRAQESKLRVYESELLLIQQAQSINTKETDLLSRIQDLQSQLREVAQKRDTLQSQVDSFGAIQSRDASFWQNKVEELERRARDAERRADLLPDLLQQMAIPPSVVILKENSVEYLTLGRPAKTITIGVDNLGDRAEEVEVSIWTSRCPEPIRRDGATLRFRDESEERCRARGDDGGLCYLVRKQQTDARTQEPTAFTLEGVRYELRATSWDQSAGGKPDRLSLIIYAVPQESGFNPGSGGGGGPSSYSEECGRNWCFDPVTLTCRPGPCFGPSRDF